MKRVFKLLSLIPLLMPMGASAAYLAVLPSEANVREALSGSPRIAMAREGLTIAQAHRRQLEAGPHEWEVAVMEQQRRDFTGINTSEQAYELLRAWRLPGKAGLDRELGAQVVVLSDLSFADAWHEAGRDLLAGWFDWLRKTQAQRILADQVQLLREQLASIESRVRAGESRAVDRALAQTELDRGSAALVAAELEQQQTVLDLKQLYPGLSLTEPGTLDEPAPVGLDDDSWLRALTDDNHEIELAEAQQAQAKLAAARAGRDRVADPTVGLRYSRNLDGNDHVIDLTVTMPLGGAGRSAAYAAALGEARIAAEHTREAHLKVDADARRAIAAARAAYTQWQHLSSTAQLARQGATAVSHGYALGEFTVTEVLMSRRQALEADLAASAARLDALESQARLQLDSHQMWLPPGEEAHRP